jgi:PPK2 family polyphosphate:nucleotide phosphotransferase
MNIQCRIEDFRVREGARVNLKQWRTRVAPFYESKSHYRQLLEEYVSELSALQDRLYAHDRYAVLLIFQGMDAAGKDGAIKHVMSGVNPQGCQVYSFKQPSSEELDHDFLWRTNQRLPERGRIGIFNRSYYEEVIVVRVRPQLLAAQRLPKECVTKQIWRERFRDIVNLEDYLHRNGTRILKFFLHLSKEEQRQRLLARLENPDKNWKFNRSDLEVRRDWEKYQRAYEDCLAATSTNRAPWHIVPADDKQNARLIISHIIVETLKSLPTSYPKVTAQQRKELLALRRLLKK